VTDPAPRPSPDTQRLLGRLGSELLPDLQTLGGLELGVATGSRALGFTDHSDLDVLLVWTRVPSAECKALVRGLADPDPEPVSFAQPGFCLDRFWLAGQQIDITHRKVAEVEGWLADLAQPQGWSRSVWPSPVVGLSALRYGLPLLGDWQGRDAAQAGLEALRSATATALEDKSAAYESELRKSSDRREGLLVHELLVDLVHTTLVAWFAHHGHLYPFAKWLAEWAEHLGLDVAIVEAERAIWTAETTEERCSRALGLAERVLAAM
jgi:hypothetical protein